MHSTTEAGPHGCCPECCEKCQREDEAHEEAQAWAIGSDGGWRISGLGGEPVPEPTQARLEASVRLLIVRLDDSTPVGMRTDVFRVGVSPVDGLAWFNRHEAVLGRGGQPVPYMWTMLYLTEDTWSG